MFNFNTDKIVFNTDIETSYHGKKLILKNVYRYQGPITMQLLPYGGIQSVYGYNLIVNTKDGFISCNNVVYDNLLQSTKDFIMNHPNLVNSVLGID